jgi:2'-5' RNA ligase
MESSLRGYGATTQFALVSYIPEPLGSFLSDLRTELVPHCRLQSHVTLLTPRPLANPTWALIDELRRETARLDSFEVELCQLEIFPVTNVIYLSIGKGRDEIVRMHDALARDMFDYNEPFPFHPHITLAQEIPEDAINDVFTRACARWEAWDRPRSFPVDELVFVRNVNMRGWEDLSSHPLKPAQTLQPR